MKCHRRNGKQEPGSGRRLKDVVLAVVVLWSLQAGVVTAQNGPPGGSDHQLRVRVRVRILEWQLNNQLDTGFTVRYLRDVEHPSNNIAAADATFPNSAGPLGLNMFFNRIQMGPGQAEIALQALESTNRLRILSEPVLTVNAKSGKNDKSIPAKFTSGRDIPYETLRPSNGVLLSVTEFRETGITLNIDEAEVYEFQGDPTQRFVRMKFHVNVSRAGQEVPVNVTKEREIVTQFRVLSRDLNTTLFIPEHSPFIAGIIKARTETANTSGVPFLSEIPVVGALFRSNNERKMDTELVFMVTAEVLWPDNPPLVETARASESTGTAAAGLEQTLTAPSAPSASPVPSAPASPPAVPPAATPAPPPPSVDVTPPPPKEGNPS